MGGFVHSGAAPRKPARRIAPQGARAGGATAATAVPDPQVERPARRTFTAEYKKRILEQVDRCRPGELGALLRREGLYSSH
ncbi:MAG: hypothetical protein QME96_09665, partial [Myxococcota bacterium]|nr:hypothetical protein [Myxococcota bacterium]